MRYVPSDVTGLFIITSDFTYCAHISCFLICALFFATYDVVTVFYRTVLEYGATETLLLL